MRLPRLDRPALALALAAAATLPFLVQPHWEPRADAARYLLAARSLARGEGYRVQGEPFTLRPPGTSVLLLPVVAWRGLDFRALNLWGSLIGVGAVLLLFAHLRARAGPAVALAGAAALWLNPEFQRGCNLAMSDVPGLAAALLALLLIRRSRLAPSPAADAAAGVAIAAALYVRTANLALLPALVLDRLTAPSARGAAAAARLRGTVAPLALALVLYAPWIAWSSMRPPADEGYAPRIDSYWSALWRGPDGLEAPAPAAGQWRERLGHNAGTYLSLLGTALAEPRGGRARQALGALVAAALAWQLARRREAAEWFAAGSFAMLLVYFTSVPRLALAAGVLALAAALVTIHELSRKAMPASAATVFACLAAAGVGLGAFEPDFMPPGGEERFAHLRRAADALRESAAPTDRVGGDVGPVYALLLDRPVAALRPAAVRGGLPAMLSALDDRGVSLVVVEEDGPCGALVAHAPAAGWPVRRYGPYAVVRVRPAGPSALAAELLAAGQLLRGERPGRVAVAGVHALGGAGLALGVHEPDVLLPALDVELDRGALGQRLLEQVRAPGVLFRLGDVDAVDRPLRVVDDREHALGGRLGRSGLGVRCPGGAGGRHQGERGAKDPMFHRRHLGREST
jgi:hypothetical protein